ncbi:MAG: dCTP deaminase [bacterium]
MKLSDGGILEELKKGNIFIEDFNIKRLNPNSYNLRLHNEIVMYKRSLDGKPLDMKAKMETISIDINKEKGFLMEPNRLYLARTLEYTKTYNLVPGLEGRSSIGRLGIDIHATAGFGDNGFEGYWTLELSCKEPVYIYPFIEICQIYYEPLKGSIYTTYSSGKYQKNKGIQGSKIYKEFI